MRSLMARLCLLALLGVPLIGCDSGGGIEEGIPKDAANSPPPPMPGMDGMREKMEKK